MSGEVIKVEYENLDDAVTAMKTIKGEVDEDLAELRTQLDALDWIGADREAYEESKADWDNSIGRLNSILEGIASTVLAAKEQYKEGEDGFVTVFSP
ncbi:MAG TPA: WXG100 family type VII secretion target [Glycomyces sp.]|nr:WXG100 family type VII secretion target [Glycomyces sp.]